MKRHEPPTLSDIYANREAEKASIEKKLGIRDGEAIYAYDGLEVRASSGGEAPCLILTTSEGTKLRLEDSHASLLGSALLMRGVRWCKEGYCEGMC